MRNRRQNIIPTISWLSKEDAYYEFNDENNLSDSFPDLDGKEFHQLVNQITVILTPVDMITVKNNLQVIIK